MQLLSLASDIVGIGGAIFSLFAWLKARQIQKEFEQERMRQDSKIEIYLQPAGDSPSIKLPVPLRRSQLTRAEVMGRIGMIPLNDGTQKRFSLRYTNSPLFIKQIEEIRAGKNQGLYISCSPQEMQQFDFGRMELV